MSTHLTTTDALRHAAETIERAERRAPGMLSPEFTREIKALCDFILSSSGPEDSGNRICSISIEA